MKKLELKHLAYYLPYDVKIYVLHNPFTLTLDNEVDNECISVREVLESNNEFKPILRPLSDLTKEITIDGETFISIGKLGTRYSSIKCMLYENTVQLDVYDISSINLLCYINVFEKLYSMHFDLFGLIEKGLAIDINTLR